MKSFGIQLYTLRDYMQDEPSIQKAMTTVKKLGYSHVQVYGSLDLSLKIGIAAKNAGLDVLGSTGSFDEFINNPEKTIEIHKQLDAEEIGIGGYYYNNISDIKSFIEKANKFADYVYKNGFKFSYHNHSHEFIRYENGKTAFEMLSEGLNLNSTSFVLDTYWVQHGGGDVRYWIEKLKNRINILHLKDMKRGTEHPEFAEIGIGNMYWNGIIKTAEECGVKHFVVEQDISENPFDSIKISSEYISENFINRR